jgi:hypothetical protein
VDGDDVQEVGEVGPNGGGELRPTVRGEDLGEAKAGKPMRAEGLSTGRGRSGGKRNGLCPTGRSVHEGEDVGVALGWGKGANNVNVYMGKTAGRNGYGHRRGLCVEMYFCFLARDTLTGPLVDISGHGSPKETGRNEASGGTDARMAQGMDMFKDLTPAGKRNKRAESGSGHITEKGNCRRKWDGSNG